MVAIHHEDYVHVFSLDGTTATYEHSIDLSVHNDIVTTPIPQPVITQLETEYGVEGFSNINHIPQRR